MKGIILDAFEGIFPSTVKELSDKTSIKIHKVREILRSNPDLFFECGKRFNEMGLRSPETLWLRTENGMRESTTMVTAVRKSRDRKARNIPILCQGYGRGYSAHEQNIDETQGIGEFV